MKHKLKLLALSLLSGGTLATCVQCTSTNQASQQAAAFFSEAYPDVIEVEPFVRSSELDAELAQQVSIEQGRGFQHKLSSRAWNSASGLVEEVQSWLEENPGASTGYRIQSAEQVREAFETIAKMEKGKSK